MGKDNDTLQLYPHLANNISLKQQIKFSKAESELTALSYKIDQEYSALAAEEGKSSRDPSDLIRNVQTLRAELTFVSNEMQEVQKKQHEVMSSIQSQVDVLCGQVDDLSKITGEVALAEGSKNCK